MKIFLTIITKIFLIGLLFQFVVHTFVTFKLGLDMERMKYIRMRKEFVIVGLAVLLVFLLRKYQQRSILRKDKHIRYLELILAASIVITAAISLLRHGQPVSEYIAALKYDFFGFIIFFIFFHLSTRLGDKQGYKILERYITLIKRLLVLAIFRWLIIRIKPGALKLLGYNPNIYEGIVGSAPPSVYLTEIWFGITRNQFLFERPIMRGFFLNAFWPLFFVQVLKRKRLKDVRGRWLIYGLNIGLTTSRAARGTWIIQTFFLLCITYRKHLKKIIFGVAIPFVVGVSALLRLNPTLSVEREYSNTGHIQSIIKGRKMLMQKPLFGHGASMAGPGSHQLDDPSLAFNPENQFLQIFDEFGIVGAIGRMALFAYLVLIMIGPVLRIRTNSKKEQHPQDRIIIAFATGMLGLAISGMVLHSFSDRMIVYPFMALYGIGLGIVKKTNALS